jgi:hypothetical protein
MIMDIKTQLTNCLDNIEKVLIKGNRVEIIPVKDGIKVLEIKRKEIK